jgi:hypothetical protein
MANSKPYGRSDHPRDDLIATFIGCKRRRPISGKDLLV